MLKKLTLILLCSPGLLAMTQDKLSTPLKLKLSDDMVIEVPRYVAELSKTIEDTLELIDDDQPISLPQVSQADWHLMHKSLALAYRFTKKKTQSSQQALLESLRELSAKELVSCMITADYLAIPIIIDACLTGAFAGHLDALSYENLSFLPPHFVHEILFRRACAVCGPYEVAQRAVCTGHKQAVVGVCLTADGKIVSASETLRIWDIEGKQRAICENPERYGYVSAFCLTSDGKIASGEYDKTVRVWDLQGNQLAACNGHISHINAVCVTPDGKIVSASDDRTVRIWDSEGNELAVCEGHECTVLAVCVSPDGKIVSGSSDWTVRIWDSEGNELAVCLGHEGFVKAVCITPDGKFISAAYDWTVRIWDMEGNQLAVCDGHEDDVNAVCVTPDGKIVSGSDDKTVRIWNMEGNQLAVCERHEDDVIVVCVTQDGKIVSGSQDNTVRVWDTEGNQLAVCEGHKRHILAVCVTPDGKIVSGSADGTVRVWDATLRLTDAQAEQVWLYLQENPLEGTKLNGWKQIKQLINEVEELLTNERD